MQSDNLRYYYQHLYPYEVLYRWLTYNDTYYFMHRELSFEYENGIVQRYVKFRSPAEMRSRMTSTMEEVPRKVDAGAIWTGIPAKDNKEFKPMEREFIFDFDMNDYDDVRTCCQGKTTCVKCWKFLLVAKEVITTALTEDFQFEKYMFVFSGGRGIHFWVCDQRARKMTDAVRKSIVDYLEVVTGNDKSDSLLADNVFAAHTKIFHKSDNKNESKSKDKIKQEMLQNMHPHLSRSLTIVKKWFLPIFTDQKSLELQEKGKNCREVIYKILEARNKKLKERVEHRWANCEKNTEKMWIELCEEVDHYERAATSEEYPLKSHEISQRRYERITFIEQEIMLSFIYPRMDYNVSTSQNHLLKLPFSVHPSTGNISVPLFSHEVDKFNPRECVTIEKLIKQLMELDKEGELEYGKNIENAHKTLLGMHLRAMQSFCAQL